MPPNREDLVIQRILIRHGFTREMADELLIEMKSVLDEFAQNPPERASNSLVGAGSSPQDHSGRVGGRPKAEDDHKLVAAVAKLKAKGASVRVIAKEMGISPTR